MASRTDNLIVVGIGASAGGIDALRALFKALPANTGLAFVVIQHLAPDHESMMDSLLSACTDMPVSQIRRRTPLEPNQVYVTPPNKYVTINRDHVGLTRPLEQRGRQMAIDFFFDALARSKREAAIGIVLSGTGSDGSVGLRAIKENGGMSIAQDPKTAPYESMPINAISTGMVDHILPLARMPDVLIRYARHPYAAGMTDDDKEPGGLPDHLSAILALLRTRLDRDFRHYKKGMLIRRVKRRMGIVHVDDMEKYYALLQDDAGELGNLFKDLLVGVTQFFRDPGTFEALAKTAITTIIRHQDPALPVRIWVPGCSTGEEAYTIAMVMIEGAAAQKREPNFQIFATDIDAAALTQARAGSFPLVIENDLSPARLRRFFVKKNDRYQVIKQVRESITFAEQNLISDPPFSRLDLISCRNLLIYLDAELQKKIIPLFHYVLNDNGFLFLGTSETIGRQRSLFEAVDKKSKIFYRLNPVRRPKVDLPLATRGTDRFQNSEPVSGAGKRRVTFSDLTHRLLSETYAPAAVLINQKGEPLYFFGPTDRYLRLPAGDSHQNLAAMARPGLASKLRSLIATAVRTGRRAGMETVGVQKNSGYAKVTVSVRPVRGLKDRGDLFLVAFSEADGPRDPRTERSGAMPSDLAVSDGEYLERELQAAREELQDTIEAMETSNEELKAANEEAMSMNEELQSTNEELETSKEELQSLNEELNTVNSELQDKVEQLEESRNDIANLLASTQIATVFLDEDMRIKRFTPKLQKLIKLMPADIGRDLGDFTRAVDDPDLESDARKVFSDLKPLEREVRADDGGWYIRRILPYRTEANEIGGVVLTFVEVTDLKMAELETARLATVMRDSNDAIILHEMDGRILAWNRGAEKMYGYSQAEALGMNIRRLVPGTERDSIRDIVERAVETGGGQSVDTRRRTRDKRVLDVWLTLTVLRDADGKPYAIASTERDITERLRIEGALQKSRDELEARVEERTRELIAAMNELRQARDEANAANSAKSNFLATMSHDLRTPLNGILGYSEAILAGQLGYDCGSQCKGHIRQIHEAGTHLHQLINDILDLSLVEFGDMDLTEEVVDIREAVGACRTLIQPLVDKAGIDLRVNIAEGLPPLFCDERRLKQILVNLLSNAIKFAGTQKRVIFRAGLDKKGKMIFRVADKGPGMSRQQVVRALQPFSQIDSSITRTNEGAGLGLPIAMKLAEAHGCSLSVRSKPGAGTTVTVSFPAERVRA